MRTLSARIALPTILLWAASAASAQEIRPYVGVGGGLAVTSVNNQSTGKSEAVGAPGVMVFAGVRFNPQFALEAEYISAGTFQPTGFRQDSSGYGLSALIGWPVGNWNFYGKLGLTSITTKLSAAPGYTLTVPDTETKSGGVALGGGAEYSLNSTTALRMGLSSYEISAGGGALKGRFSILHVGAVFSF